MFFRSFTAPECDWFRAACNFTPDERRIFDLRVRDCSCVEIALKLDVSESTVHRRIRSIKRKINRVR